MRALLFGVCIRDPDLLKIQYNNHRRGEMQQDNFPAALCVYTHVFALIVVLL